jgi:hypothetical protein
MIRVLALAALACAQGYTAAGAVKEGDVSSLTDTIGENCEAIKAPVRFLKVGETRDRVSVASYPRSGNSLTRSMTQAISGVWAGSDMGGGIPGAAKTEKGEKIFDNTVFAIKTHW